MIQAFKTLVDDFGGDQWDWNGTCMASSGNGECMDSPSFPIEWYSKRHRAIALIDPTTPTTNQDPALLNRWECVFVEKVADAFYKNGVPTGNGSGPPGQWNVYVRFTRCADGMKPGPETGETLKTLRLVRY